MNENTNPQGFKKKNLGKEEREEERKRKIEGKESRKYRKIERKERNRKQLQNLTIRSGTTYNNK